MDPAKKTRFIFIGSIVGVILVIGIVLWLLYARTYEETDDAQINGHINSVAARIEGTVTNVAVDNNHYVKAGEPLVDLDPKDYQVAYDQANAQLLQAKLSAKAAQPNLSITRSSNRADTTSAAADVATAYAMVSAAPWLVGFSRHKLWTFSISGTLIAASFVITYVVAPRLGQGEACASDDPTTCGEISKLSRVVLCSSALIWSGGFFVAYLLGPILEQMDR